MSRKINKDFQAFNSFLLKYDLSSYSAVSEQAKLCKNMHKKLFGLLIFNAEFKSQDVQPDSILFFEEVASDLLLSLFCVVQGMYKPAQLQLRCSIENFLKALVMVNTPLITQEKSVYAVFDAAKADRMFSTAYGGTCVNSLHSEYATLCRTVHGDPSVMHSTSALALLPQYDPILQGKISTIYTRTIEIYLGILYLNYPAVVDKMHPENKKDFLDCMTKKTKGEVIKTLYDD